MLRRWTRARRGISNESLLGRFLALGAVLAAPLLPVLGTGRVQGAADDVVANAGEVLDAAAPDQHHRVLLKVVPDPRDAGGHLCLAGQAPPGPLPEGRVRLLRGGGVDAHADAAPLGRAA